MLRWRRVVVARPWLIFLVGRTWPCLRSSLSFGGRPAFLLARRRSTRSAPRARRQYLAGLVPVVAPSCLGLAALVLLLLLIKQINSDAFFAVYCGRARSFSVHAWEAKIVYRHTSRVLIYPS